MQLAFETIKCARAPNGANNHQVRLEKRCGSMGVDGAHLALTENLRVAGSIPAQGTTMCGSSCRLKFPEVRTP